MVAGGEWRQEEHPAFGIRAIKDEAQQSQLLPEVVLRDVVPVDENAVTGKVLGETVYRSWAVHPVKGAVDHRKDRDGAEGKYPGAVAVATCLAQDVALVVAS